MMKSKQEIMTRLRDCKVPDEKYLDMLVPSARYAEETRWETERLVLEWVLKDSEEGIMTHNKFWDDVHKDNSGCSNHNFWYEEGIYESYVERRVKELIDKYNININGD